MGITNLKNFYFKKGSNNAYSSSGSYAVLDDYVGKCNINNTTVFPLCNFFKDYNNANTNKVVRHVSAPSTITNYDSGFSTTPLWQNKTYYKGTAENPARKYDTDILKNLYLTTNNSNYSTMTSIFYPAGGAGVILVSGGGGGGGGGDSGGWLDEPAGGAGGGSGGWAVFYYRYKNDVYQRPTADCFEVTFGTSSNIWSGNFQAAGGGRESYGSTGAFAIVRYKSVNIISCGGGGGGASDNTSNTTYGGGGGTISTAVQSGSGTNVLVNDSNLYIRLLASGAGVSGQNSGQGGASGSAGCVSAQTISIPSSAGSASIAWGNKGGGSGGKKHNSDPGGGGGAGSIYGRGGNGNTGDKAAGDGSYGAGGGGASERGSYSGKGGYAVALHYKYT